MTRRLAARSLPLAAALLCAAAGLAACGPVTRGVAQYEDGKYYAALRTFRGIERRWRDESPQARADYALYRGLTHLRLRDDPGAQYWLASAWGENVRHPGVLDAARMSLWREGWSRVVVPAAAAARYAAASDDAP